MENDKKGMFFGCAFSLMAYNYNNSKTYHSWKLLPLLLKFVAPKDSALRSC
jgi:hypothetical protein